MGLQFTQHYSSSAGNLYTVTSASGERLIIDPGVQWKRLQKALKFDFSGIVGCLMTHEHGDHSHSAKEVLRAGIDIHASQGTLDAVGVASQRRAIPFPEVEGSVVHVGIGSSFMVHPFRTEHDAAQPTGFVIIDMDSEEKMLFAVDTSHIRQRFERTDFNIIAIECSYDRDLLRERIESGEVPEFLGGRILRSHMERQITLDYVQRCCVLDRCRELHLLHLSGGNINKEEAVKHLEDRLFLETITV